MRAYKWKRRPKSDDAMRRKIARAFGSTPESKVAIVPGPDYKPVRIRFSQVFRHFWKDHKDRWSDVPIIRKAIENAYRISGNGTKKDILLYSSNLDVGHRDGASTQQHFATFVEQKRPGQRSWRTSFAVTRRDLERRETAAGHELWPRRHTPSPSNPITVSAGTTDALRPGRASAASLNPTISGNADASICTLIVLLGGLMVLAHSQGQQQEYQQYGASTV